MHKINLLALLFLAGSIQLFSQQMFKASEAFSWAADRAEESLGATTRLKAIATANGISAGQFTTSYNPQSGQANTWVYSFENDQGQEDHIIAARLLVFIDASDFVGDISSFTTFLPENILSTENWIDSDVAGNTLINSSDYQNLAGKYPDGDLRFAALGNNEMNMALALDEPYWIFTFEDGNQETLFICDVHAESNNITCFDMMDDSSVNEIPEGVNFEQDANSIYISFSDSRYLEQELYIYDISGKVVYSSSTVATINIDRNNLPKGALFLTVFGSQNQFTIRIINND